MKNLQKVIGIAIMIMAIVFSMSACGGAGAENTTSGTYDDYNKLIAALNKGVPSSSLKSTYSLSVEMSALTTGIPGYQGFINNDSLKVMLIVYKDIDAAGFASIRTIINDAITPDSLIKDPDVPSYAELWEADYNFGLNLCEAIWFKSAGYDGIYYPAGTVTVGIGIK